VRSAAAIVGYLSVQSSPVRVSSARMRVRGKKPGFPRLSGQWSPPAYGGAGVKMCVLAQFPVDLHAGAGETARPASRETAVFAWRGSYRSGLGWGRQRGF